MSPHLRRVQSDATRRRQFERDLGAMPWETRPVINWHALGWSLTILAICSFLMGLLAVGAK